MRLPLVVIAVMLAVLIPVGFAFESDTTASSPPTPIKTIAERVEELRGLSFKTFPEPLRVTAELAKMEGLADFDASYPSEERAADEFIYATIGLLPIGTDLRELSESIFGSQVAGYYDPRSNRLRIVEQSAINRVTDEMTIAHELVHALEDQRIGIDLDAAERSDDAGYAYTALLEGTATVVMYEYVGRFFDSETALGGLLASGIAAPSTADLPPFIVAGLTFPYLQGQQFVADLHRRTESWQLVDVALRDRPPVSTEQVMHPEKWLAAEQPRRVAVPSPGPGWKRTRTGVFGEWQTSQLLALGGRARPEAAEGWGGDRYALFERGRQQVLVMRWVHDSADDGKQFLEALRVYADNYTVNGTEIAIGADSNGVTLAFAPDAALARRLSLSRA